MAATRIIKLFAIILLAPVFVFVVNPKFAAATPGPYCDGINVVQQGNNLKITFDIDNHDDDATVYRVQVIRSSDNAVMYDSQTRNCDDNTQVNCIYNSLLSCPWSDSTNIHGVVCSDPMVVTVPAPSPGDYYIKAGVDDDCTQCCGSLISGCEGDCPDSAVITVTPGGLTNRPLVDIINDITVWILGIAAAIAILFIVIGGLYYVTAGGDERQMESAKQTITYAIWGIFVIAIAYAIVVVVNGLVGG